MEDERVDKLARIIITQAAKLLETNRASNPNYQLIKEEGAQWSLIYILDTPFGNLMGYYNPLPAVKMMIKDTFDMSQDRSPEDARANFEALFTSVLRLVHNFPTMMLLSLKKYTLLSLARPHYEYQEYLSDCLRAGGDAVPARRFKDVLDSLPALKEINDQERRLGGVSKPGNPHKKTKRGESGQQATTPHQFSLADFSIGILGLPLLSEYEREQQGLWLKVFSAVYNAKTRGMGNEYLHQDYLADGILGLTAGDDALPGSAARRLRRALKKYELSYTEIRREAIHAAAVSKKVRRKSKTDI